MCKAYVCCNQGPLKEAPRETGDSDNDLVRLFAASVEGHCLLTGGPQPYHGVLPVVLCWLPCVPRVQGPARWVGGCDKRVLSAINGAQLI